MILKKRRIYSLLFIGMLFCGFSSGATITFHTITDPAMVEMFPHTQSGSVPSGDFLPLTSDDAPTSGNGPINPIGGTTAGFMDLSDDGDSDLIGATQTGVVVIDIDDFNGEGIATVSITDIDLQGITRYYGDPMDFDVEDTPAGGPNTGTYNGYTYAYSAITDIEVTTPMSTLNFDDFPQSGYIVPICALRYVGCGILGLDDILDKYPGGSVAFEKWLYAKIIPNLPQGTTALLFGQGQDTKWIFLFGTSRLYITIIGYTTDPFPTLPVNFWGDGTSIGQDPYLVADFSVSEPGGDVLIDHSRYGNDGTIIGATWSNDTYGTYLCFDGSDDYVSCEGSSLALTNEFTVAVRLKDAAKRVEVIVDQDTWNTGETIPAEEWKYLVVTFRSGGSRKFYLDGVYQGETNCPSITARDGKLLIGAKDDPQDFFNGMMGEICIYNRILSGAEIRDYENKGRKDLRKLR